MNRTQRGCTEPRPGKVDQNEWEGYGRLDALVHEIAKALGWTSEFQRPNRGITTSGPPKLIDHKKIATGLLVKKAR